MDTRTFLHKAMPYWDSLLAEQQAELADAAVFHEVAEGQDLYGLMRERQGMFIVKSGRVRVFITAQGEDITLFRLRPLETFGMNILGAQSRLLRNMGMEAELAGSIAFLPAQLCRRLSRTSIDWQLHIQEKMASRLGAVIDLLYGLAFATTEHRLAAALLSRMQAGGASLRVTHDALARDLGTAREVVSRTLKTLERRGLLRLGRGRIDIIDVDALRQV